MDKMQRMMVCLVMALPMATTVTAQEKTDLTPHIHGTIRGKYEYQPDDHAGRFEVRNARFSVEGKVARAVAYKAEIDLSEEGQIKMLDAYTRLTPLDGFQLTIGQMRVPFTIDAHRSPHQQYFANRSFIAKQVGHAGLADKLGISIDSGGRAVQRFRTYQSKRLLDQGSELLR